MQSLENFIGNKDTVLFKTIEVERILAYNKSKKIEFYLKPSNILNNEETQSVLDAIAQEYPLVLVEVLWNYRDITLCNENIENYQQHITQYAANGDSAILKCVFLDCVWEIDDNNINITTKYGGLDIINSKKLDKKIEKCIFDETGNKYNINIIDQSNEDDYEQLVQKQEQEMNKRVEDYISNKAEVETGIAPIVTSSKLDDEEGEILSVIKGRKIKDNEEITYIANINANSGKVIIKGDIISVQSRDIKSGKTIITFSITDYTSSIKIKIFEGEKEDASEEKKATKNEKLKKILSALKPDIRVIVIGRAEYDEFDKEVVIMGSSICLTERPERMDNAKVKRVELHLHTQMSAMDATLSIKDAIATAAKWGHTAIAITDHGVVQAFPDAYNAAKNSEIKPIFGLEGYIDGDSLSIAYNVKDTDNIDGTFVVFDLETTGLTPNKDNIIEIGAVKIHNGIIIDRYSSFVNPNFPIPEFISKMTNITDAMVKDAPDEATVINEFLAFAKDSVLVAHNANFDVGFVKVIAAKMGIPFEFGYVDTVDLCRALFTGQKKHSLKVMVKYLDIDLANHHRAVDDAEATAEILKRCLEILKNREIIFLHQINKDLLKGNEKKAKYYHIIILAKNKIGLQNLYQIITKSHMEHFYKRPIITKELIEKYREGLIIGSACEAGELFRALLNGVKWSEVKKIASLYDYFEIQPIENNKYLEREGRVGCSDELRNINKQIVRLGEKMGKLVVATGDVHFLNAQDEVFRRILMFGNGYPDADLQAPLYFKTTEEMLEEFSYLGEEKAYEVVVENTNKIASSIDNIQLLPDEPHPPRMDGAEEEIKQISLEKAVEIYGSPLPEIVRSRMERELDSIIKHGFSVMYIIAKKLVWKSLEDGYLVGSRGSVGSSFVAYLTGITEVNSLQPHYICPNCKHSEFVTDGSIGTGYDLEDKVCHLCNIEYIKNGHDIPFETFLGFDGDKEPDIDLNFSGEYQANAHKYTEELFGTGYVFRAGTIGTVAEKTAYGYVKKYFEAKNITVSSAEIDRLVKGCVGVKRTTGQHPGGIMVVPKDEDIHNYCPVQHPADDQESEIITTHFDYHSISGKLLKLDILGHDDPTVIRMLEDLTGLDATTIRLDDKATMGIFTGTEPLGVTPNDIGSKVGSFGVPEFGTSFVRKMLVDTEPTTFAELVRISGLSHGTDVWLNNAQEIIKNGTATLKDVICTRDDIMTYLIYAGLPKIDSFRIMESVRRGDGVSPEQEEIMAANNVPNWYIASCKKIKYMFPKAHAAAYVMMAFRIAYFKVHHPKEFYATYFTVRADEFDANIMTGTHENIRENLEYYQKQENLSAKEKNVLTILEMCNEMYARKIEFLTIDIYKSDAKKFIPMDEGILPPLNALAGLGSSAAISIIEEREKGEFFSVEDLRKRTKVSKTVIELLKSQKCLGDLPDTAQVSMF